FKTYLAWIKRRRRPYRPVDPAILIDLNSGARTHEAHIEDQELAAQERRELGVHGELLDGHCRLFFRTVADNDDVTESHGRKRQQSGTCRAIDPNFAAQDSSRLTLEISAIIGPI